MKTFFTFIINTLYIFVIVFVVISLSFAALSHKEQIAAQDTSQPIIGTVVKHEVPVLSSIHGSVHTMKLSVGQQVTQQEVLLQLTSSDSASTKAKTGDVVGLQDIVSPLKGTVEKIFVDDGFAVYPDSQLVTILSDEDMSVSVALSDEEFHRLSKLSKVTFYSKRLDQSFIAVPGVIDPSVNSDGVTNRTITVSYTFVNTRDAVSLLQGEQLQVLLPDPPTMSILSFSQLKSLFHL